MNSRQLEQVARQRTTELTAPRSAISPTRGAGNAPGASIRSQAGWALVSIGLRLADSGTH
jgi:hypothetical protein